jgi:dolichol-phosphate mannosyltransferase
MEGMNSADPRKSEPDGTGGRPEGTPVCSVVIPVYNEEAVIRESYRRLAEALEGVPDLAFELVFVDDGSRDGSRSILKGICASDRRAKLVAFSRNFGHQAAISAGMAYASGRCVVVIDADLQDPPEVIPAMIARWREGYDVVYGRRIRRKGETRFKRFSAAGFYRLLRALSDQDIPADAGDFRLLDRRVCDVLNALPERNRYVRGLVAWAGYRQTAVEYVREERFAGETKYTLAKMVRLSLDALTTFTRPLRVATWIGFALSGFSFLYLLAALYLKLFTRVTYPGWTSLIVVSLFFNGVVLIMLGLLGEYISRILEEVKHRPIYLTDETVNLPAAAGPEVGPRGSEGSSG